VVLGLFAVANGREDAICNFVGSIDYRALESSLRSAMDVLAVRLPDQWVANMGDAHAWVENMTRGELFLNPWAAPTVRSAAPIDLNNMAVM
jgi:hypothetical protein